MHKKFVHKDFKWKNKIRKEAASNIYTCKFVIINGHRSGGTNPKGGGANLSIILANFPENSLKTK